MMILDRVSPLRLLKRDNVIVGLFEAMNCSCEVLVDTEDAGLARELLEMASAETWRIERKLSRYIQGNIVNQINRGGGEPVHVDDETALLLEFAHRAFQLSEGLFDVTSGVLRKAWKFDGADKVPSESEVRQLLPLVGWNKVKWERPVLQLRPGMEIDLGGIGKEYAVDRAMQLLSRRSNAGFLVNFGGDIAVGNERRDGAPWKVGIEDVHRVDHAIRTLYIKEGALATSGDSKKFVLADGRRYGHILDPRTGWPVVGSPRSVTVAADSCSEAGFLSTVAVLHGNKASSFLKNVGARHWCAWN